MRVGVLEQPQPVDSLPKHTISATLAAAFLNHRHNRKPACIAVGPNRIKIVAELTFEYLKRLLKGRQCYEIPTYSRNYPVLEVPKRTFWREALLLTYPHRDQSSFA